METTAAQPPRQRTPLKPVSVRAHFVGGANRQDVIDGSAVMAVVNLDTGEEVPSWVEAVYAGGRWTGFQVRKLGGEEAHALPRDLSGCTRPDRKFKPGRPGGCKHMVALRAVLGTLRK